MYRVVLFLFINNKKNRETVTKAQQVLQAKSKLAISQEIEKGALI